MSDNNISIKEADRKVFRSAFDDGLVDIFISCVVLMFAVGPYLSVYLGDFLSSAIFLPFWGFVVLILFLIRRSVIKPRAGTVIYGLQRRKKLTLYTGIMLTLYIVFFILGLVAFTHFVSPGWISFIPFTAMVLISFSLAGFFLDVTRFYLYGLMLAGGFFVGEWLYRSLGVPHHGYPIVFGISAGVIFLVGIFKLMTFVQNNPLPREDQIQWQRNNG